MKNLTNRVPVYSTTQDDRGSNILEHVPQRKTDSNISLEQASIKFNVLQQTIKETLNKEGWLVTNEITPSAYNFLLNLYKPKSNSELSILKKQLLNCVDTRDLTLHDGNYQNICKANPVSLALMAAHLELLNVCYSVVIENKEVSFPNRIKSSKFKRNKNMYSKVINNNILLAYKEHEEKLNPTNSI